MFCLYDTVHKFYLEEGNDMVSGVRVFSDYAQAEQYRDDLVGDEYPNPLEVHPYENRVVFKYICEIPHLFLKADTLYYFGVDPNCDKCKIAAYNAKH